MFLRFLSLLTLSLLISSAFAQDHKSNTLDELDPFADNIEQQLEDLDKIYTEETGESPVLDESQVEQSTFNKKGCRRAKCRLWLETIKSSQTMNVYIDGVLEYTWKVSTGVSGRRTPNFERHPNGRIYRKYSSRKFPGGDYNGLGNMPYAIFIYKGFAIHGTTRGNWSKLGRRASKGCIRLHPDNAKIINDLTRRFGIYQTWITVR